MTSLTAEGALRAAEWIAAFGQLISTGEHLANRRQFGRDGIYSWRVLRSRPGVFVHRRFTRLVDVVFDMPVFAGILGLRLAFIALVLLPLPNPLLNTVALAGIVGTTFLLNYRHSYGQDGSDQMSSLIFVTLLIVRLGPQSSLLSAAGVWFIALQSCASYCIAGIAKVQGPKWRAGDAVFQILNTESYGMRPVAHFLSGHVSISRVLTWSVVAIECAFPLAVCLGPVVCVLFLLWGFAFHVANATIMGLNSFLWAFLATYPAIFWCALHGPFFR